MILLISGKPAAIKQGSSFEYTSDNRLFADRDDYTMNIELPLDIRANAEIFGNINRKDADIETIYFDAEIIADDWHKTGAVVLTSITDTMAKVQFIAGRSYQNFYPAFDGTYIDELDLGLIPNWVPNNMQSGGGNSGGGNSGGSSGGGGRRRAGRSGYATSRGDGPRSQPSVPKSTDDAWGANDIIALPWVNASSGNMQNRVDLVPTSSTTWYFAWHTNQDDNDDTEVVTGLSCQIRLYKIVEMICQALGYAFNAEGWRNSDYYYLYSFNSVPYAWGECGWQDTLPHWTVNELFEHLEKLMLCEFDIDHKAKSVSFSWSNENVADAGTVAIDNVVDEFTATVGKEDESQYRALRNLGYADGGHNMSNIYSCYWYFHKNNVYTVNFATLNELIAWLNSRDISFYAGEVLDWVFHVDEVDNYFVFYAIDRQLYKGNGFLTDYVNFCWLVPLNAYGDRIFDADDWNSKEEIGIIPVWMDDVDNGLLPFFDAGELDNESFSGQTYKSNNRNQSGADGDVEWDQVLQSRRFQRIKDGDNGGKTDYSTLQVGFWYGYNNNEQQFGWYYLPQPFLDKYNVIATFDYNKHTKAFSWHYWRKDSGHNGSLRLNSDQYGQGARLAQTIKIDNRKKYEFSFLSDDLPDVRAIFIIRGHKYLCASIKTDINENGMSELKKGTFYRILE